MDTLRADQPERRRRRWLLIGACVLACTGVAVALGRMEPAVPSVDRNLIWVDTVKRGSMLRQARGIGSLVPEDVAWLAARTEGRVEKIVLHAGAEVTADSVILVLANPQVQQAAADAASELRSAEAAVQAYRAQLETAALAAEAAAAEAKATQEEAKLKAEMNERLFQKGLVPEIDLRLSKVTAAQAKTHHEIEGKRAAFTRQSIKPQLAVKIAEVERAQAQAKLRLEEAEALQVRAGMKGVLQSVPVEVGAQVTPGTNLARVADPVRLKAAIRIPETQAKDVQIGQAVTIDTRNGMVPGQVSRIDPAANSGTVLVDVAVRGTLPPGARPDLSIDGTIDLERVANALFVGRPAFGEERSTVSMFKLDQQGRYASRIEVELGKSSVNKIEIVRGLQAGDRVILSDTSQWDEAQRIRLE